MPLESEKKMRKRYMQTKIFKNEGQKLPHLMKDIKLQIQETLQNFNQNKSKYNNAQAHHNQTTKNNRLE